MAEWRNSRMAEWTVYYYLISCTLLCCHYIYSGFHMHVISPRATINISKCIITGRIVAVEQTPFSAALEEDWLAPVISSLTFAFSEL